MTLAADEVGNTARAISETSETLSLGRAPILTVKYETPRKSVIEITPRITSVCAAFRPLGWRKAPTPFEIASTPVRATAPEANARTTTNRRTAQKPAVTGTGTVA